MTDARPSYKFGLYGRCPVCKDISQEVCEGCGATEAFTDSSKPGIVICAECNLEHSIKCDKPGCSNQIKVLRTPKNTDEKGRIDEFIFRKQNKDMDKRVFIIKESPQTTVVKEVKVPVEELKKKKDESIISFNSGFDMELLNDTKANKVPEIKVEQAAPKAEPEKKEIKVVQPEKQETKRATPEKQAPIISLKDEVQKQSELPASSKEPAHEDKQELDKIKNFWKTKELSEKEEKKEEERRIVNQFYDEHEDDALDKKINFENIYNETAYFDCKVCGKEEQKIVCEKCGLFNQFSLNYDSLSCKCANDIKVKTCNCGAKHGHSDFYLVSDGIKWQYSKSKSYYNYRKGRMLVFSTCPTCGVFSVEKCKVCGSKVNFGFQNKNNEVYCKNCGSVNQFLCENRNCNDSVKSLKNPNSIEQQLEWLNEVMNFKSRVTGDKVKYNEPGAELKKSKPARTPSNIEVSIGDDSTPDFSNSFIEDFDSKTKEIITSSFISEVEDEVNQRKKLQDELKNFNKTQVATQPAKPTFAAPSSSKPAAPPVGFGNIEMEESSTPSVISFDDSGSGIKKYVIIGIIALVVIAGAAWGYFTFIAKNDGAEQVQTEVAVPVQPDPAAAEPAAAAPADKKAEVKKAEPDKNAAQTYIDAQKKNIQNAKDAVEKSNKATEDQLQQLK